MVPSPFRSPPTLPVTEEDGEVGSVHRAVPIDVTETFGPAIIAGVRAAADAGALERAAQQSALGLDEVGTVRARGMRRSVRARVRGAGRAVAEVGAAEPAKDAADTIEHSPITQRRPIHRRGARW